MTVGFLLACVLFFTLEPLPKTCAEDWSANGWSAIRAAHAQPTARELRVLEIKVEGNKYKETEAIKQEINLKPGHLFNIKQVRRDVRSIWRMGTFEDIRVDVKELEKGVVVTYIVKEKPTIRKIIVGGYEEFDLDKINETLDLKKNAILDVPRVKKNAEKIREAYVDKGFYLAEVDYEIRRVKKDKVDIRFKIDEGHKVIIRKIRFIGNKSLSGDKLRSAMRTQEGGFFSFLTSSGTYKESHFNQDLVLLRAFYYDHGFINVKLGNPQIALSADKRFMYITIPIREGHRYKLGKLDFKGELLAFKKKDGERKPIPVSPKEKKQYAQTKKRYMKKLTSKSDHMFNRSKLAKDIMRITAVYKNSGFAYANVSPITNVDVDQRIVHITFEVEKGPPVTVERINIVGNSKTRDKVIRRELVISEGDRYNARKLALSKRRVLQLGFFKEVKLTTRKGSSPDHIVVTIKVAERPTGTFQVGAGFSSVENFIAQAQISQNNLFGRGQTLSLQAQMSSLRQIFILRFVEPYFLDSKWTFAFTLYNSLTNYESFNRNATGGTLTWGYPITHDLRAYLTYKAETVSVDTGGSNVLLSGSSRLVIPSTAVIANLFNDGVTSSVRATLSWDTRDNRLFPTKGFYQNFSVEFASPYLGSQNVFNRYRAFSRWYYPLYKKDIVLKLNAEIGMIASSQAEGVPIFERFFVGGIYSVRGFRPRSLGPTVKVPTSPDPGAKLFEFPKGGNKELVFNLELEFNIFAKVGIKGVLFFDAGNAFDDSENFTVYPDLAGWRENKPLLRTAWGFGLRWFSPIGPLRFEWGLPLVRQPGEERIVFEFTIGNMF
jgi:outer membrane protein insertion porin family